MENRRIALVGTGVFVCIAFGSIFFHHADFYIINLWLVLTDFKKGGSHKSSVFFVIMLLYIAWYLRQLLLTDFRCHVFFYYWKRSLTLLTSLATYILPKSSSYVYTFYNVIE